MVAPATILRLDQRRRDLAITHAALAARSGVSMPTVKRILGGRMGEASFAHVSAIAAALGVAVEFADTDVDEVLRAQARKKAEAIARLVQGTSALEDQGVDRETIARLVERTYHELLAGPRRALWEA